MAGILYAGTSGFAYPDWAPRFYTSATRGDSLLAEYARRLPAVELNNTFYQQPRPQRVAAWLAATPPSFRFTAIAQRGSMARGLGGQAAEAIGWLTAPYRLFGERLGSMLFRIPDRVQRDDGRLTALLAVWPADLPLAVEFRHQSWVDDGVHALLAERGAVLCATDLDGAPPPDLRLTGPFLYLRLRRTSYSASELASWADRLSAFLADGRDAFAFFRHDADGQAAVHAMALRERVARLLG